MLHRHVTLEAYERALEEDSPAAMRMRARAARCLTCAAALTQPPLAPLLRAWELSGEGRPVDWQSALRHAIAPVEQPPARGLPHAARFLLAGGLLLALIMGTILPAAASTGPGSALYPVRGAEEEARWQLTPEKDRAAMDAELTATYSWQATSSATHHDQAGYQQAMQRVFTWADRLKADVRRASPSQRSGTRDTVHTAISLVSPLAASGPDPAQAHRAKSLMEEAEVESEGGRGHHDGGDHGDHGDHG